MSGTDLWPFTVAILHEECGLSVSLTDSRSVARFGRIEVDPSLLEGIAERAARVFRIAPGRDASREIRELGAMIFSRLLPETIRGVLTRSPARPIYLQMSESLSAIPWEIAFDGDSFLGEKFPISRQIVSDEEEAPVRPVRPARDVLRVLVLGSGPAAETQDGHIHALLARLGKIEGVAAKQVLLSDRDVLRRIGEHDVVHFVGPISGEAAADGDVGWWHAGESLSLAAIASLPYPPLLVSERTDGSFPVAAEGNALLPKAACRWGLNLLARGPASVNEAGPHFMQEFYRELARASTLGEAVRDASAMARRSTLGAGIVYPAVALYGDCSLVLFPPLERAREGDHYRQVTALSYDLVNSTRLIDELGDETYSARLESCHDRCRSIVERHGGSSRDPQGNDGVMCYFGFPVAYEDSAAQAVRAGLAIIDAVAELGVYVRVGIVTGQILVRAGRPFGKPIHLAARLQSRAEAGTVLASDSTIAVVRNRFHFERLGPIKVLKDFGDDPGEYHRVIGESRTSVTDWFEAAPRLTPFVGREEELRLLEQHWAAARRGSIRTVLIAGEAGIGKSRLMREFRRSLAASDHEAIELRCTAEQANSAYHPVIDYLRRLLQIQDGADIQSKLAALAARIGAEGATPLIAALLSVLFESADSRLRFSAEKRRQMTLDLLVNWIRTEAESCPVCLIVEDIQWIDPSTREFLGRLDGDVAASPLLVVSTERVDPKQARRHAAAEFTIELKGLSRDATREMIQGACGETAIPSDVMRLLADKADGVPLFIEESTRMVVDRATADSAVPESMLSFSVPSSLEDLLMARVDQLAGAKQVAQLGGAIGREFALPLLEAVLLHESSPIKADNLASRLDALVNSGLLIESGEPPDTSYLFKHALVRDAAYNSLLPSTRVSLHHTIAVVIRERFWSLEQSQPELLAYHYTKAGIDSEAVTYWERAARHATSRSAQIEAIGYLNSGVSVVRRLPDPIDRDRGELRLQLLLAGQLIATDGYGAERVERVYARASDLCRMAGDDAQQMKILMGLEGYHFMRGDFGQAHEIAVQAAALVAHSADPMRRLQSQWAIASILFHQGGLVSAVARMDACIDEYDRMQEHPTAMQDPGVMCLCYSAWGLWELGYVDEAIARARKVVALAERRNHRFSMGEALGFCTSVHHFRGENEAALKCAERAIQICEEGGFAVWLAHAKLMRGRIVAECGDSEAGIAEMEQAYRMWSATGAVVTTPFHLAMQAEGLALARRFDEGLALLQRAYEIVCKYGERYYEPEVMRLSGELTLQSAAVRRPDADAEAERWFLGALDSARQRQLRSMELRSATSLARLYSAQGRVTEAYDVLAPAYEWFHEGAQTRDLRTARTLLEVLRPEHASV